MIKNKKINFNKFIPAIAVLAFCAFLPSANAALILNHPNYTGLNNGLVGFWTFDGKDIAGFPSTATTPGTVYDRSGQGNNGLYYNATGTQPVLGKLGQALEFDGADNIVTMSNSSSLNLTSSNMTVSAWVKFNSAGGTTRAIVSGGDATGGVESDDYMLTYRSTGDCNANNSFNFARYDGVWNCASYTINPTIGNWYHVVGAYDGTSVKLFVDGLQQASGAGGGATAAAIDRTAIGKRFSSGNFFDGTIDDVRIYNRALSADEIKRLYRIGGTLHVNSGDLGKNDTLQKGLVGYWSFDGKDIALGSGGVLTAYDKSGNQISSLGTTTNGIPTLTFGKIGQAANFDGVNDYMEADSDSFTNLLPGDFSASVWIYPIGPGIVMGADYCGTDAGYSIWSIEKKSTGTIQSRLTGSASVVILSSVKPFNVWQHAVAIRNGTQMYLYVDGVLEATGTEPAGVTNGIAHLYFGARGWSFTDPGSCGTNFFNGTIDDVRIYNRALTADEIKRLYKIGGTLHVNSGELGKNDTLQKGLVGHWTFDGKDVAGIPSTATSPGTVYDRSGQGNNGLYYNATGTQPVLGKLGQALNFDGVNDFISLGLYTSEQTTYSVSVWFKTTGTETDDALIYRGDADFGFNNPQISIDTNGSVIIFQESGFAGAGLIVSHSISVGDWHHAVLTRDGQIAKAYVDGQLVATDSNQPSPPAGTDGDFVIGAFNNSDNINRFSHSKIDDVRIYNRVLSADEIKRLYNLGR